MLSLKPTLTFRHGDGLLHLALKSISISYAEVLNQLNQLVTAVLLKF